MKNSKIAFILMLIAALAGCVSVTKLESGERPIGDRLFVTLVGAWNQINAPNIGPAQLWTMEGVPVDQLLIYSGLKDQMAIHAERATFGDSVRKSFIFRSDMQAHAIASLFEGMLTRDGSSFKLLKLEPAAFGGEKGGFRFDFSLIRKYDNVQLSGFGYATVSKGDLFAIVYMAPRLTFFSRHQIRVEAIAKSARIKSI